MWLDNECPGCLFDTKDCTGNCCEEGRIMYDRYIAEKYPSESIDGIALEVLEIAIDKTKITKTKLKNRL